MKRDGMTEEEMRLALFGASRVGVQVRPEPDDAAVASVAKATERRRSAKAFGARVKVTLRVGNEFEGETQELVHNVETLSTLLAEQEAVKKARKKFRFIDVVSVKRI